MGGGSNLEKVGPRKGGGPKGWGPERVGPRKGGGPEGWGAQNFALFLPFPVTVSLFLCLSGCLSRGILVVFEAQVP